MRKRLIHLGDLTVLSDVGGKAQALNEMIRAGFNVPAGFVVTTQSYQLLDDVLKSEILDSFDLLSCKYVAVRSSATGEDGRNDAWAGQLSTFLYTTKDNVIANIEKCWQSLNSEKIKAYAQQKSISIGKIAVIIQSMTEGEVSGVAFSAHPVTGSREEVVIEACLGLGEALVSGLITPDMYVVSKKSFILERHIHQQSKRYSKGEFGGVTSIDILSDEAGNQKLKDDQILALTTLVKRLEALFGYAVDVEWTYRDGDFFILQCRPITTL